MRTDSIIDSRDLAKRQQELQDLKDALEAAREERQEIGDKRPQKQTARAWIRKGLHGDLSEEPEFVRSTFAAIKTRK